MPTLHSKDEERLKPKFLFSQTNQKWFYEKRNSSCDTEKNKLGKNNNNQQYILLIEKNEIEEDNNNDNDENMSNNIRKKNIIEVEQQKNEKEEEVITENNKDKKEKKKGKNTSRKKSVDHIKIDYSDKDRETIEQDITERNVFKVKDRKIILTTFGYKDDNNHNNKIHNHKSAQNKKHKKINSFQKFQIFKFNSTNKFPLKPETITYNSKQIDCPEAGYFDDLRQQGLLPPPRPSSVRECDRTEAEPPSPDRTPAEPFPTPRWRSPAPPGASAPYRWRSSHCPTGPSGR